MRLNKCQVDWWREIHRQLSWWCEDRWLRSFEYYDVLFKLESEEGIIQRHQLLYFIYDFSGNTYGK